MILYSSRHTRRSRHLPVALLTLILGTPVDAPQAQPQPVIRLPAPARVIAEPFTRVAAFRELTDSSTLVFDETERQLFLVDWTRGTRTKVGRKGSGPAEYGFISALLPAPGDSTLAVDRDQGRWTMLHGATAARVITAEHPAVRALIGGPIGASRQGALLGARLAIRPGTRPNPRDSMDLVVVRITDGSQRIVGKLPSPFAAAAGEAAVARSASKAPATERKTYMMAAAGHDQATMFDDGAVALVRVAPYRVEWTFADGTRVAGKPIESARQPFTSLARGHFVAWSRLSTDWPPTNDLEQTAGWPDDIPAFTGSGSESLFAAPGGNLLVARTRTAVEGRCDLIDRRGDRIASVALERNERVVGVGRRFLYVVSIDADGLQSLRRHLFSATVPRLR